MKFIYRYIKPYGFAIILGLIIKFIGTISDLVLPSVLARLIDVEAPQKDFTGIIICALIMLIFSVIAYVFNVTANRMASKVAKNSCEKIRHDLFEKTLMLSCNKTYRRHLQSSQLYRKNTANGSKSAYSSHRRNHCHPCYGQSFDACASVHPALYFGYRLHRFKKGHRPLRKASGIGGRHGKGSA